MIEVSLQLQPRRVRPAQCLVDKLWSLATRAAGCARDAWEAQLLLERYLKHEAELRRLRCTVSFRDVVAP